MPRLVVTKLPNRMTSDCCCKEIFSKRTLSCSTSWSCLPDFSISNCSIALPVSCLSPAELLVSEASAFWWLSSPLSKLSIFSLTNASHFENNAFLIGCSFILKVEFELYVQNWNGFLAIDIEVGHRDAQQPHGILYFFLKQQFFDCF